MKLPIKTVGYARSQLRHNLDVAALETEERIALKSGDTKSAQKWRDQINEKKAEALLIGLDP